MIKYFTELIFSWFYNQIWYFLLEATFNFLITNQQFTIYNTLNTLSLINIPRKATLDIQMLNLQNN